MSEETLHLESVRRYIIDFKRKSSHLQQDHLLAHLCYVNYLKTEKRTPIIKPLFLAIWLSSVSSVPENLLLERYTFFDTPELKVTNKTNKELVIQLLGASSTSPRRLIYFVDVTIETMIKHPYPISLQSLLDLLPMSNAKSRVEARIGSLYCLKEPVNLEEEETQEISDLRLSVGESVCKYYNEDSMAVSTHSYTVVTSSSEHSHYNMLKVYSNLFRLPVVLERRRYIKEVHFPARELSLNSFIKFFSYNQRSAYYGQSEIYLENFLGTRWCRILQLTLTSSRCYKDGSTEIYRSKGDQVLIIVLEGEEDIVNFVNKLSELTKSWDPPDKGDYPNIYKLGCSNLSKLRTLDPVMFDSKYARIAPPKAQVIPIPKEEIDETLKSGRMVVKYQGNYYTTTPGSKYKYLGMMRIPDQELTSNSYVLRAYSTNHLVSNKGKTIKGYIMKDPKPYSGGFKGYIDPEILLLPKSLEKLYRLEIKNPHTAPGLPHTKKLTNPIKNPYVQTGDLPDNVRKLIGDPNAVRKVDIRVNSNGLLESLGLTPEELCNFIRANNILFPDTDPLDLEEVCKLISTRRASHRLIGVYTRYLTEECLVFDDRGLVPNRRSLYNKGPFVCLYLGPDKVYSKILPGPGKRLDQKLLLSLAERCNNRSLQTANKVCPYISPPIDYIWTHIKLVSYISRRFTSLGYEVGYSIVEPAESKNIVLEASKVLVPYEGYHSKTGTDYYVDCEIYRNEVKFSPGVGFLLIHYWMLVKELGQKYIIIKSPVDFTQYHLLNYTLQDSFYQVVVGYRLGKLERLRVSTALEDEKSQVSNQTSQS